MGSKHTIFQPLACCVLLKLHCTLEWSRALPVLPEKVAQDTFSLYQGNVSYRSVDLLAPSYGQT